MMAPLEYIRRHLFDASQEDFAKIAGATQSAVSRWERGQSEPSRDEMDTIRAAAKKRKLPWSDTLFFEVPGPQVKRKTS